MPIARPKLKQVIYLVIVVILLVPQTRKPIQVFLNKGLALISPSLEKGATLTKLPTYNLSLKDKNQKAYNLESAKGKVLFINFWATWCPPCIAEMPSMQALYNDYSNQVEFAFITTDWFSEVETFKEKHKYTFKVYRAEQGFPEALEVNTIPRTFLVDKTGNIVIDKRGAANWNSDLVRKTLDSLLAQ